MIERLVTSKDFSSPFTLRLLASALYSAVNKSDVRKEACKTVDRNPVTESSGVDQLEAGLCGKNNHEGGIAIPETCLFQKKKKSGELESEPLIELKTKFGEETELPGNDSPMEDGILNKKLFFSSDSEDSTNSDWGSARKLPKVGARDKSLKHHLSKKEVEELDKEEADLEGLLRLATRRINFGDSKSESEKDDNIGEKKGVTEIRYKKVEENLLEFVEPGEPPESVTGEKYWSDTEKDDFEVELMSGLKNAFLLTSDEEIEMSDVLVPRGGKRKMKKEKKTKKYTNKSKNDIKYLNLCLSSGTEDGDGDGEDDDDDGDDDGINREEDSDKNEKGDKDYKIEEDSMEETDTSSDLFLNKKSMKRKVLQNLSESSDSDIQQIPVVKSVDSPTKGRKNINKILKKEYLEVSTKQARKLEAERKKRLAERQKMLEGLGLPEGDDTLVLDFDPVTKKELVVVDRNLCQMLKPHQRKGVKFMWDNCFESLKRMEEDSGSGCILAHCMGLGKTLQVITLIHTLLTHDTGVKLVMIICPFSTVRNWLKEFDMWLSQCKDTVDPFEIITCKSNNEKMNKIKTWAERGGVLVISYEIYRVMTSKKRSDRNRFLPALSDPGPDLVVCDEGHLLKNTKSLLSKCMTRIKTQRRIVLTGTPLQNNLMEYYCMVQFVKPNILGTQREFMNGFVNPIKNGQFEDSTQMDVRIMKRRAHVLHSLLEGFIQRFGYYVLTPLLPEKEEYVISISLTETQDKLYRMFVQKCQGESSKSDGLLHNFHWLQKVLTHPLVLINNPGKNAVHSMDSHLRPLKSERAVQPQWRDIVGEHEYEDLKSSGKLVILFKILKSCRQIGDKILVFSQYLSSLSLIEYFLRQANENHHGKSDEYEFADSWVHGLDYFRIDGTTSSEDRFSYCQKFNNISSKRARLLLISTRTGGVGINLIGANRVVIFDVSWNPSHDVQSIFRIYRFGQNKPCYIYRFLAEATIEEKIYQRQVTKLSLAHRIVDEHQIERHYSMMNLNELYRYAPTPKTLWKIPNVPKDSLFAEILASSRDIIVRYHEHDSLLENKEEEELTEEERQAAWEEFEKDRFQPLEHIPPKPVISPLARTGTSYCDVINKEALQMVHTYKSGLMQASEVVGQPFFLEGVENMCRIVDVRTLNQQRQIVCRGGRWNPIQRTPQDMPSSFPLVER